MKYILLSMVAALFLGCRGVQQVPVVPNEEAQALLALCSNAGVDSLKRANEGDMTKLLEWRASRLGVAPRIAPPEGVRVEDFDGGVRYTQPGKKPTALMVYLHGGGWALGSTDTCERYIFGVMPNVPGLEVLSLNYPLSPEARFPEPLEWIVDKLRKERASHPGLPIIVSGDSAGGNLSAAAALHSPSLVDGLLLFYPVVYMDKDDSPEWMMYRDLLVLSEPMMLAMDRIYTDAQTAKTSPLASPLLASDAQLRALPPTHMISAECDVLAGQGRMFVERCQKLGAPVTREIVPGTVHGFVTIDFMPNAREQACLRASKWLNAMLGTFSKRQAE